jgi:hypothetical protein
MSQTAALRRTLLTLAVLSVAASAVRAGLDVSDTPNLVWSNGKTSVTPECDVKFHGDFSNECITATLDKLPAHDYLQISVQLLIIRSWDGSARANGPGRMGPDFFRLGLDDGRTLVHACFSNTPVLSGFAPAGAWQTYPSPVPGDRVPYMTGADFKNNFGYIFPKMGNQPSITVRQDALYTLKMTVPHSGEKVALKFSGMGLQELADESWGVTSVRITPRTRNQMGTLGFGDKDLYDTFIDGDGHEYKMLSLPSYGRLLQTAAGRDALAANEAFWKLVTAGDGTAAFLAKNVKPVAVDSAKIAALAAPLYEDAPPTDETDTRIQALVKLGPTAEPVLRDQRIDRNESPARLDWALMEVGIMPVEDPELRQWIVATRILEAIGTAEAKKARAALIAAPKKEPENPR